MGFQRLFLIICPYTFVLVHTRHNSKQKKGKLVILLMDNLSPGCLPNEGGSLTGCCLCRTQAPGVTVSISHCNVEFACCNSF